MVSRLQNRFELLNEAFMLLSSYWLIVFTDFIPSIDMRRKLGEVHIYFTSLFLGVSILMVLKELLTQFVRKRRIAAAKKKMKPTIEKLEKLASSPIELKDLGSLPAKIRRKKVSS